MKMIVLQGGSLNGREIPDLGIAKEWDGDRPKVGSEAGYAVYEPDERRENAYFSHNVWDGVVGGIVERDEDTDPEDWWKR